MTSRHRFPGGGIFGFFWHGEEETQGPPAAVLAFGGSSPSLFFFFSLLFFFWGLIMYAVLRGFSALASAWMVDPFAALVFVG